MKTLSTLLALLILLSATQLMAAFVPPSGLAPGSQYQLIFVTSDIIYATSSDISAYNAFVTAEAALNPLLPSGATWKAVVSTAAKNAFSNAPSIGLPVYNTAGGEVASGATGLYTPNLLSNIEFNQYGIANSTEDPWTGSNYDGTAAFYLGGTLSTWGDAYTTLPLWANDTLGGSPYASNREQLPLFALSDPLTVPTPEPATLTLLGLGILGIGGIRFLRWRRTTCSSALVAALLLAAFAALDSPVTQLQAAVIPPSGLAPGSQYQLIFVTADQRDATSSDISDYNAFVTAEAALNPSLPAGVTWNAVASTATVNANGNAPSGGLPVYNTQGQEVAASSIYSPGYGDDFNPYLLNAIQFDQYGFYQPELVWTGSFSSGYANNYSAPLGGPYQPYFPGESAAGVSEVTNGEWAEFTTQPVTELNSLYALSSSITVPAPEPAASTLVVSAFFVIGGLRFFRWRGLRRDRFGLQAIQR